METSDNFHLFDEVVSTAARWKKRETRAVMHRHSLDVRQAQRFCVSKQLVRDILENASIVNLKRWANLARLPYKRTWVEFDLHDKLRAAQERGTLRQPFDPEEVASHMGLLLHTLDEDSGLWSMTVFVNVREKIQQELGSHESALPQELVYFYAPEGPSTELAKLPPEYGLRPSLPEHTQHIALGVTDTNTQGKPDWVAIPEFENRVQMAWEPSWASIRHTTGKNNQQWDRKALDRLVEDAGLLRFAIVLLAMLNAAPNVREYVAPQSGHRFRGGKMIPYMGHNNLTIQLPKGGFRSVVRRLNVAADDRRRNRAHMVRGHFRQVERGKVMVAPCRHEPTLVENGLGVCLRCERLIRWVPEFQRGDASIGWVNHDYHLERRTA